MNKHHKVDFFYNAHVNYNSFVRAVKTANRYSPDSIIHFYVDSELSEELKDKYVKYGEDNPFMRIVLCNPEQSCLFVKRSDSYEQNYPKIKEWLRRIYDCCIHSYAEWIVRLEDDVYMLRPINVYPGSPCAGNHEHMGGLGGGSIMLRQIYVDIYRDVLSDDYLTDMIKNRGERIWAADLLVKDMFVENNFEYSRWGEIKEDWLNKDADCAFHHGDKSLYEMSYLAERELLNPDGSIRS